MDSGNLDSEHSEDIMRPPHALRSNRKRVGSKGEADKGNRRKKICTEETLLKVNSDVLSIAQTAFINDLKKESNVADCDAVKTSTPNGAENLPQKRRKRGSTTEVDTSVSASLSQLDVSYASEKSQAEETSGDDKSLELSGVTDDSKQLERSGRRNKCTSARVLLGLEKRKSKELIGQPQEGKEKSIEVMSADRKPKARRPKVKQEVLPKVQHEVLSSSLEGLPDTPPSSLSVERCTVVKPDWLYPFKLGWRREIVFRNTAKNPPSSKQLCDVYYFSSDDTKLRSLPQIIDYLKSVKSTLTGECFTFSKCSIYKEPQEMVRAAGFSRGRVTRRTGLLSSNESSMKSFDEANDDASSQASSTGKNRKRKLQETLIANYDSGKADVSVKTESPVIHAIEDSPPIAPVKLDVKKEEASPDAGVVMPVDETDKRQAVRAAATLALRTYMSHALRTVNNPLLQSGNIKPSEKEKTVSSKSPTKSKTVFTQSKHQLPRKSLSPVVSIRRLSSNKAGDAQNSSHPEERAGRQKGPPSGMNLAKLKAKRSEESHSKSQEPMTSKAVKLKARSLLSAAATPRTVPAEKSVRDHKKMSPLKKSTPKPSVSADPPAGSVASFEKINAAIKALMSDKDDQPSPKKLSKSCQQATPVPAKALSKSKTPIILPSPVGKVLPKSDGKSNEKPLLSTERKQAVAPVSVMPKPVESCLIETSRICGMDCPGRLGIPPTLPCATCMCLFHPECAGYTSHMYFTPQINFTCWACGKLNKELEKTAYGLYKRETSASDGSSLEASSRNAKKQFAVGKSKSNGVNSAGDTIALSSQKIHQSSNHSSDAAAATDHANILQPSISLSSISLSGMATEEVVVSCGPSAQLLVIPAALARHLNMSQPLTLLVDDREIQVKPEQLKVSGMGLSIMLPMGSVPDAFVEGPGKPLEFRVVSSAESGRQAVAVSLFERPLKLSSALETFSSRKASDPIGVSRSDSVAEADSGITDLNKSNMVTSDLETGAVTCDKDEQSLECSSGQGTESTKCDGPLSSDESTGEVVASTVCGGVTDECKAMDARENVNVKEDYDLEKSESGVGISRKVNSGKMVEDENTVSEKELDIPEGSDNSPTEANLSFSLEPEKEVIGTSMEAPVVDVSREAECFFPIAGSQSNSIGEITAEGIVHDSCREKATNDESPVALSTADEGIGSVKEREIAEFAMVVGNSSSASCDERDETDTLGGNQLQSIELKEKIDSSLKTDAVSSREEIAVEEANAGE